MNRNYDSVLINHLTDHLKTLITASKKPGDL